VLSPEVRFYQRLLAMEFEEAVELAREFIKGKSLEELEDQVIVPALTLAEADRHRGCLDEQREQFILQSTRSIIQQLSREAEKPREKHRATRKQTSLAAPPHLDKFEEHEAVVVCIPARDEADELAAEMIEQLLVKRGVKARVLSCAALAGECVEQIKGSETKVVCVAVVPPFGYAHARYLCRRLRAEFPNLRVIAAVLTEREVDELKKRRPQLNADEVAPSLRQTLAAILSFLPTTNQPVAQPAAGT
jgi:hypothetical protein